MTASNRGDARADLARLGGRGLDWHRFAPARMTVDASHARRSAVLMLFGPSDDADPRRPITVDRTEVLLLERSRTLRHHPGQIGFPGGGLEPGDADLSAAAVREAVEETGVDASGIELFAPLPPLPLAVSDNLVTPVPAWWRHPSPVRVVDTAETAAVFRLRVADLVDPAHRVNVTRVGGRRTPPMPAFQVDGHLVWGFTAIILSALFDTLGWTLPWDPTQQVEPDL